MPFARRTILACLLALGSALLSQPAAAQLSKDLEGRMGSVQGVLRCTPQAVTLPDGTVVTDRAPLARALELAAPGARVELSAGEYERLTLGLTSKSWWSCRSKGGQANAPIQVSGFGARLVNRGDSDTLGIADKVPVGFIHFEGLQIDGGQRAGVMFYNLPDNRAHEGFHFVDCHIDGGYNHAAQEGRNSKWGVLGHDLKDFVFAGRLGRASVKNVRHEHAFYLQNPRGDLTLENIDASALGRTFVQITARPHQGPVGRGTITVRGNHVSDIGLGPWDDHKGGSAFTFAGRLTKCRILVENNTYRAGFDPLLKKLTKGRAPYGTGAFVAWSDNGELNGDLVLSGNSFEFASGCGDRPVVSIGACKSVTFGPGNRFVSGSDYAALAIDPVQAGTSNLVSPANLAVRYESAPTLRGKATQRGKALKLPGS